MIVIINPNSTISMTDAMLATAQKACPDADIRAWTSLDGPAAIQGPEDGAASIRPLLKLVEKAAARGARAIIIGCFDDTGLDAARAQVSCPVIGIGQAAYHLAAMTGRFSVVTTLAVSTPILEANIQTYGLGGQLGKVRASGVPVLALETDPDASAAKVLASIKTAQAEDDIQSVVLGCAGMSFIQDHAGPDVTVRLIDSVKTAAQISVLF